jgi:cation diffusion facilitator family transporter
MTKRTRLSGKQLGYVEGWISVASNTVLFAIKLWAGFSVGSIAMVADAWHTLSDSLTSIVVIVGFWLSGKPADSRHPFGHGRAELVSSVVVGTLLGAVGLHFLLDSINRLSAVRGAQFGELAIAVFAGSAVVKEVLARFAIWAGRRSGSSSLVADGWHHRSDAVASAVIVVAAFLSSSYWWIDGVLGIAVSILVLHAAYRVVSQGAQQLLGDRIDPELEDRICRAVSESVPDALDCHHFHLHRYGDHAEVTLHIYVAPDRTVREAHEIADQVGALLQERFRMVATVHVEPDEPGRAESSS